MPSAVLMSGLVVAYALLEEPPARYVVLGLIPVAIVGAVLFTPSEALWLEDDAVVRREGRRTTRIPLHQVTDVHAEFVPKSGVWIRVEGAGTHIVFRPSDDRGTAFRRALGRRLPERFHYRGQLSPDVREALGLES